MKLKIEIDCPAHVDAIKAVKNALARKETKEMIDAFPAGEHFKMEDDQQKIAITFTVVEK